VEYKNKKRRCNSGRHTKTEKKERKRKMREKCTIQIQVRVRVDVVSLGRVVAADEGERVNLHKRVLRLTERLRSLPSCERQWKELETRWTEENNKTRTTLYNTTSRLSCILHLRPEAHRLIQVLHLLVPLHIQHRNDRRAGARRHQSGGLFLRVQAFRIWAFELLLWRFLD
jgi:hypothetical protein